MATELMYRQGGFNDLKYCSSPVDEDLGLVLGGTDSLHDLGRGYVSVLLPDI